MSQAVKAPLGIVKNIKTGFFLLLGAWLYAYGLEMFLVPNDIIDGGVVGIALMAEELTGLEFSFWFVLINLPFIIMGWRNIGWRFAVSTVVSVIAMSIFSEWYHNPDAVTRDAFLSSIFGGVVAGLGCGLIIRNGGSLDGTEIVAIIMNRRISFSVGEIVLGFNLFILGSAGLLWGWDKAMYSLITYFVIARMIDIVVKGFDDNYAVFIISHKHEEVTKALVEMGGGVTLLHGAGGYMGDAREGIYCVVNRLELESLKTNVRSVDPDAFLTINSVREMVGGRIKRN